PFRNLLNPEAKQASLSLLGKRPDLIPKLAVSTGVEFVTIAPHFNAAMIPAHVLKEKVFGSEQSFNEKFGEKGAKDAVKGKDFWSVESWGKAIHEVMLPPKADGTYGDPFLALAMHASSMGHMGLQLGIVLGVANMPMSSLVSRSEIATARGISGTGIKSVLAGEASLGVLGTKAVTALGKPLLHSTGATVTQLAMIEGAAEAVIESNPVYDKLIKGYSKEYDKEYDGLKPEEQKKYESKRDYVKRKVTESVRGVASKVAFYSLLLKPNLPGSAPGRNAKESKVLERGKRSAKSVGMNARTGRAYEQKAKEIDSLLKRMPVAQKKKAQLRKILLSASEADLQDFVKLGTGIISAKLGKSVFQPRPEQESFLKDVGRIFSVLRTPFKKGGTQFVVLEGGTGVGKTTAAPSIVTEMLKDGKVLIFTQGKMSTEQMTAQFVNRNVRRLMDLALGRHVEIRSIKAEEMSHLEGKVLPKLEHADVVIVDRKVAQQIRIQADHLVGTGKKNTKIAIRLKKAFDSRNTLLEEGGTLTGEINLTTSEKKKTLIETERDKRTLSAMDQVRRTLIEMAFSREGKVKLGEIQKALNGKKGGEKLLFALVGETVERLYPEITRKQQIDGKVVKGRNWIPREKEIFIRDFLRTMFKDKIAAGAKIKTFSDVEQVVGREYARLLKASFNESLNAIGATGGKFIGGSGTQVILSGGEHAISIREGLVTTSRDLVEGNEIFMGMKILIQNPMFGMPSGSKLITKSKPGPVVSIMDVISGPIKNGKYIIGTGAGINAVQKELGRQYGALYVSSGKHKVIPDHVNLKSTSSKEETPILEQVYKKAEKEGKNVVILKMGEAPLNVDAQVREGAKGFRKATGHKRFDFLLMDDTQAGMLYRFDGKTP
ncbi:MAG: hypothetical protein KAR32_06345, partial [Candidatus Omnitrophica bacterium]|nr:hypothetical protein [Candidatus Omnitrophota bacterium]